MRSKHVSISRVVRYRVLVASQLSATDKDTALAEARVFLTGDQADAMVKAVPVLTSLKSPWSCFTADVLGNVKILRYKGVDVVLFYKRPVTEIEPFPGDPVPLGVIEDPRDPWVRFELLGPASREVAARSTKERLQLVKEVGALKVAVQAVAAEKDALEKQLRTARAEMELAQVAMTAEAGRSNARATADTSERETIELHARVTLAFVYAEQTEQAASDAHEIALNEQRRAGNWAQVGVVAAWAMIGLLVWVGIAAGVRIIRSSGFPTEYAPEVTPEPAYDVNELEKPKPAYTHSTAMRSSLDSYPCTDEAFRVWADAMLAGGAAGENKWTDAKSPFTTTSYPPFLEWAEVKKKFIVVETGKPKTLNQDGVDYCNAWMKRHGYLPIA